MKQGTRENAIIAASVVAMLSSFGLLTYFAAVHDDAREKHKASQAKAAARLEFEQEAIARGAAHYVIANPKTGEVEFRWKGEK